jgi:AraC family transcriptional regulator
MKTIQHQPSCHCSHCGHLPAKVLQFAAPDSQKPTYLMRGTLPAGVALKNHQTRLSVRWVANGRYTYEVDSQRFVLEPGKFLVLNNGQTYNSYVERDVRAESMTVSFDAAVLANVLGAETQKEEFLLDNPFDANAAENISFLTDVYRADGAMQKILENLVRDSGQTKTVTTALDESFYALMKQLLTEQKKISRELSNIASAKKATREELYRRVARARDFIRANFTEELKIEAIAAEVYMSPFHFLRTYKQAFQTTPHQELLNARLAKAHELLLSSKQNFSLARIALEAGFSDLSSFSKAFKQRFGTSPSRFESSN